MKICRKIRNTLLVALFAASGTTIARAAQENAAIFDLDSIDGGVTMLSLHARCESTDTKSPEPWSIVWGFTDSLNYDMATLRILGDHYGSDVYQGKWVVDIAKVIDGNINTIKHIEGNNGMHMHGRANSLRLVVDRYSARIYGGHSSQQLISDVYFNHNNPGKIGIKHSLGSKPVRNDLFKITHPSPQFATNLFGDKEQLIEYLRYSTDPTEGIWKYLDRDTDDKKAFPDGEYTLAIVRTGDDSYSILYLDGAKSFRNRWQPMQVKGRLTSLPFKRHFNLTWRDSSGTERMHEQSATLEPDGSIITFNFPLLKASMRFYKSPLSEK